MHVTTRPPLPPSPVDIARWTHSGARRRLLYGEWQGDLETRIDARVGSVRKEAWGAADMSANPFRSLATQMAVLYDRMPTISHPSDTDGTHAYRLSEALAAAGVWQLMSRVQRDTIGMRESLLRVDVSDYGGLLVRHVTSDYVTADPDQDRPDQPAGVWEARQRLTAAGTPEWTWDHTTASGGYKVVSADRSRDLTKQYVPGAEELYDELPYVLYHASVTGSLWDAYDGRELVEGTYEVGVLWTFWDHVIVDCSWPQRVAVGLTVDAGGQFGSNSGARVEVTTDPSTLLLMRPTQDLQGQPLLHQFAAGADPEVLAAAIGSYERRLIAYSGMSPADFSRVSGDPRSGYAFAISRDGQREAARRFEPQFRIADVQLISLCARALNRYHVHDPTWLPLPSSGWVIQYKAIPQTPDEQRAAREQALGLLAAGLIDRAEAYQMTHVGITREEAAAAVAAIQQEKA